MVYSCRCYIDEGSHNSGPYSMSAVHFFAKHDDRKGHHYYTRRTGKRRRIVVMTLAVIMLTTLHTLQNYEPHPYSMKREAERPM